MHRTRCTGGLPLFQSNAEPGVYRDGGDLQDLSAHGLFPFQDRRRGLGSALILEFLLYYMTKPEYQLQVREAIYLDSMLDLF